MIPLSYIFFLEKLNTIRNPLIEADDVSDILLQPCDTGDGQRNKEILNRCVEFIRQHPQWRLPFQQQKITGVR